MSETIPFTPLQHCTQCNGAINSLCVRTTPVKSPTIYPRRKVEGWCDHCQIGWRITVEVQGSGWPIVIGPKVLRGDDARSIRTYAEQQTNVIQEATR